MTLVQGNETGLNEPDPTPPSLHELERTIGYEFRDRRLLEEAMTHDSLSDCPGSYQRLEYVGDSVINLIFANDDYYQYPNLPPGSLTKLRAANVDKEKLARVAIDNLGLHRYLRHEKPLLEEKIAEFREAIKDYPLHSNGLINVPKVLADIVESTVGAVYIDNGSSFHIVSKIFKPLLEPIIGPESLKNHPVTELHQICQRWNMKVKFVDTWKETTGFDVYVDGRLVGRGEYQPKKEIAFNRAAKDALNNIDRIFGDKTRDDRVDP